MLTNEILVVVELDDVISISDIEAPDQSLLFTVYNLFPRINRLSGFFPSGPRSISFIYDMDVISTTPTIPFSLPNSKALFIVIYKLSFSTIIFCVDHLGPVIVSNSE